MAEKQWYYADGDEQLGPVSPAELRRLAEAGTLKGDDLVWCDGMDDWQPAGSLKGLLPERKPAAGPRPARPAAKAAPEKAAGPRPAPKPAASQPAEPSVSDAATQSASTSPLDSDEFDFEPPSPTASQPTRAPAGDVPAIGPPVSGAQASAPAAQIDAPAFAPPHDEEIEEGEEDAFGGLGGEAAHGTGAVYADEPRLPAVHSGHSEESEPGGIVAFLQLVMWIGCLVAVLVGVPIFLMQWDRAEDAAGRTAAAATFLLLLVAVYILVRAGERILQLFAHFGRRR